MRIRIGTDLDDTLNTLVRDWLGCYNRDYKDDVSLSDIHTWDIASHVKPECGKDIFKYTEEPGFFQTLGIEPHAYEVTKWLMEHADLYVVTAYPNSVMCHDKVEWMKKNLPHMQTNNIIFCNDKSLLDLHFLIDDGPHNIEAFKGIPIIYDRPWNQSLGDKHPRAKDWIEVQRYFAGLFGWKV